MLNNQQIKLVQTAVRAAGLRSKEFDGRYRMLLGHYRQPNRKPVESCRQLNNSQLTDILAICESMGFRQPGKPEDYYRTKAAEQIGRASFAQQAIINHLAGDLGFNDAALSKFILRMTKPSIIDTPAELTPGMASNVIEGLKHILARKDDGSERTTLGDYRDAYEEATDGSEKIPF